MNTKSRKVHIAIAGAGIAGVTLAAELAAAGEDVLVLEQDHSFPTGATARSAALFATSYFSSPEFAILTQASRAAYEAPAADFTDVPFVTPRGAIYFAGEADAEALGDLWFNVSLSKVDATLLTERSAILELVPILKWEEVLYAVYEPGARDLDVSAIYQAYLRRGRSLGMEILADAELRSARWDGQQWHIDTPSGPIVADILVNAAGAWGDVVATRSGVARKGLRPLRRTAMVVPAETEDAARLTDDMPFFFTAAEDLYVRYARGDFLISPSDATPSEPCDAQPEIEDVARAIHRFHELTDVTLRRRPRPWAGLRTFAPDKRPVIGFENDDARFVWFCGQGGYGIQTAPAAARLAASLICTGDVPDDLRALGMTADRVSPARFLEMIG
jgi:D-arginine dehydrogenase